MSEVGLKIGIILCVVGCVCKILYFYHIQNNTYQDNFPLEFMRNEY